jgi:hypothetical protein
LLRAAAAVTAGIGCIVAGAPSTASAAASASGACQVRITRWAFDPSTVPPGSQTTLTLTVHNCTDRARAVSVIWFGSGQNCPTIDPAPPTSIRLAARGNRTKTWQFSAPPCGQNGGQEHVRARVTNRHGRQLASRTTTLTVTAG